MELKGVNAIITGSTGWLGSAIAAVLAQAGCNCICHYHQHSRRAEKLAEQISAGGVKSLSVGADLTKQKGIEKLFEKALSLGTPQILINSAAIFSKQPLEKIRFELAAKVLTLNLTAPIMTSRLFAKTLKARFGSTKSVIGKIINIADIGGIRPWAGYVLYCSSKAALIAATKALAKELAPQICVNAVAPGLLTWPQHFDQNDKKRQLSLVPAARTGLPDEVAAAIISILENDYIIGQVLNVDGGRCI